MGFLQRSQDTTRAVRHHRGGRHHQPTPAITSHIQEVDTRCAVRSQPSLSSSARSAWPAAATTSRPATATDLPTKTIDVTIEGDSVTPNGDRVEVKVGQPIELVVKADAEGEIHVHSDPEQELEYGSGTTTLKAFTIDKPGIVEVESHALEKTIVQLEVRLAGERSRPCRWTGCSRTGSAGPRTCPSRSS